MNPVEKKCAASYLAVCRSKDGEPAIFDASAGEKLAASEKALGYSSFQGWFFVSVNPYV